MVALKIDIDTKIQALGRLENGFLKGFLHCASLRSK
jgi:hypothetical protein